MRLTALAGCIAGVVLVGAASFAQSPQGASFEVASVRMVASVQTGSLAELVGSQTLTDARVDIRRPLGWVLFTAFRAQYYEFQIFAPGWVNDAWVEIRATLPAGTTVAQVPEMLQRLLAERFGLVARREVRQMDGYELVVAPDGIKMREVEPLNELEKEFPPEFSSTGKPLSDTTVATPEGRVRTISVRSGYRRITSRTMFERVVVVNAGSTIKATRMTMAELTPFLWETVDAPVVDKTGLTGVYQFTLDLPRGAMGERLMAEAVQRLRGGASASTPTGVATGLKAIEGLGLKLERRRVPIEVVVVDKMSRTPTEN